MLMLCAWTLGSMYGEPAPWAEISSQAPRRAGIASPEELYMSAHNNNFATFEFLYEFPGWNSTPGDYRC